MTPPHLASLAVHFNKGEQQSHLSSHFVVVYDTEPWRARSHALLLERTHQRFFEVFEQAGFHLEPLEHRLVCLLFASEADFGRYARWAEGMDLSWTGGYYSARTNRVALYQRGWPAERPATEEPETVGSDRAHLRLSALEPAASDDRGHSLASTIHEAAHQLAFNTGLQRRGVMYPFWASEGLAISFETRRPSEPFGPEQVNRDRLPDLRRAHRDGHLLPLHSFVSLTRPPLDDPAMVPIVYAQAWALFHHLFTQHPEALRQYLTRLAQLPPGWRAPTTLQAEFVAAFGPLETLEEGWQAHLAVLAAEGE